MHAQITKEDDRKVTVTAHLGVDGDEPAVRASGLFIVPRWHDARAVAAELGSLD